MKRNPMLKKRRSWPKAISNWEYPVRSCLFHDQASEGAKNWKERTEQKEKMDSTKRLHLFVVERASLQLLVKASLHLPLDFFKAVAAAAVYTKTLRKGTKGRNRRSKPFFPFSCYDYNKASSRPEARAQTAAERRRRRRRRRAWAFTCFLSLFGFTIDFLN